MKIQTSEGVTFLADDSPLAFEIKAGKDVVVESGKIVTKPQSGLTNYWQISIAIKDAKTVGDIKDILEAMVKISMI